MNSNQSLCIESEEMSMENNRKTVRKRGVRLLSALLVMVMVFTVALSGAAFAADKTLPEILTDGCTVTVLPIASDSEYYDDLIDDAGVEADLYLVAKAVQDTGFDTYSFTFDLDGDGTADSPFKDIVPDSGEMDYDFLSAMSAEDWETMAQTVAAIALDTEAPVTESHTVPADGTTSQNVVAGLYLVVPHGEDLDLEDYVETDEDGNLVTLAYSDEYKYSFEPQLIALPTKDPVEGEINTANAGPWIDTVTIINKPTPEPLEGYLVIQKTLIDYVGIEKVTGDVNNDVATFVFQIDWTEDGKPFGDVMSISFGTGTNSSSASDSVVFERGIPIGTDVTVTEIYSGSRYKLSSTSPVTVKIPAPDAEPGEKDTEITIDGETVTAALAAFTNIHDGTFNGGGGRSNAFQYKGDGQWEYVKAEEATSK